MASGSQPARAEETRIARGLMVAPLREVHPDRIVVGDRTFFLRDRTTCTYTLGTTLEIFYTEQNGRAMAENITPVKPRR